MVNKTNNERSQVINLLISYAVKDGFANDNCKSIRAFIEELYECSIEGLRHQVFKFGESSFIHVCLYPTPELGELATTLPAFRSFLTTLQKNLANDPLTNVIAEIGHYP